VNNNVGGALVATLAGEGMVGELVLSDFDTPYNFDGSGFWGATITLPPEAMSVSLYALSFGSSNIDIAYAEGPGGKLYTQKAGTGQFLGPWLWYWVLPDGFDNGWAGIGSALSTQMPNSDAADAQLIKGGGDYDIVLEGTPFADLQLRVTVELRQSGATANGSVPINVLLAPSLPIDATSAPTDGKMQAVLARIQEVLLAAGLTLGEVEFFKLNDPGSPFEFDDVATQEELDLLLLDGPSFTTPSFSWGVDEDRLNVFFVRSLWGGTYTAITNGVPSPKPGPVFGTSNHSGIVIEYTNPPPAEVGKTTARFICHACGLWPTVMSDGVTFDIIEDTPACPLLGTSDDCPIEGMDNLLHPFDLGPQATKLTGGQRHVAVRGAFVRPG
jgi:hypothetical protein